VATAAVAKEVMAKWAVEGLEEVGLGRSESCRP